MKFKLIFLYVFLFFFNSSFAATSDNFKFDTSFLNISDEMSDISYFNNNKFPPGDYVVDFYVNGDFKKVGSVYFNDGDVLTPCIDNNSLILLGVKSEYLSESKTFCDYIGIYSDWHFYHDLYQQTLDIKIPSSYLNKKVDGILPKIFWDDGINAAFINYRGNGSVIDKKNDGHTDESLYLSLEPGLNVGGWKFRNRSYFRKSSNNNESELKSMANYVEKDLKSLDSRLVIGDYITSSEIFDSVNFRGINVATAESMIPSRMSSFIPDITGVANTTARVEVEFNNYIIYSTVVQPGKFEINDIPYVGGNGVLKVIIYESDGSIQENFVPYARPPIAVKNGFTKYDINFGRLRNDDNTFGPEIFQSSVVHGFSNDMTVFAGSQLTTVYNSYIGGVGYSLGDFGALSLDGKYSKTRFFSDSNDGGSFSFKYVKSFPSIGSNFFYNHQMNTSEGYESLNGAYDRLNGGGGASRKELISLGANKYMDCCGGVRLSYNQEKYWDDSGYSYYDVSYYKNIKSISFSLGFNNKKSSKGIHNSSLFASVNIPFGHSPRTHLKTMNYSYFNSRGGNETHSVGLSGIAYDKNLNWNLKQRYSNEDHYGVTALANYSAGVGSFGLGVSSSKYSNMYSANANGSVLISKHGFLLGQEINQSTAILLASGAEDVSILNRSGLKTNSSGKAILTGLMPYRDNNISLDPLSFPDNLEINQTDINVIPSYGAIVEGVFDTKIGGKVFIRLTSDHGKAVPFGAVVSVSGDNKNMNAGIVGFDGEVFLSGLPDFGTIEARWGKSGANICKYEFKINELRNQYEVNCEM